MNVWYVHPYAGGPGIGRYWRPYYFSKLWNQTGHQSTVITASYHHLLEPDEKRLGTQNVNGAHYAYVPTLRYLGNGIGRMLSMFIFSLMLLPVCLIRAYKKGRPDAIIYSSPHPFGVVSCWLAARCLRARFVFEVRDIWPLSLVELGGLKPTNPLVRITGWIERFAYARADKVISLLPCSEAHMLGKGLSAGKFLWIPNGVNSEDIHPRSDMRTNDFVQHVASLKEKGVFVIIYAGAHGEPNALEGLVRSAKLMVKSAVPVRIILVGKGERKAQLKEIAASEATGLIDFFDQQPKEAVMSALKLASAGYISLKSEPIFRFGVSPNKLWDYMLVGLPVIFACKAGNDPVEEYRCGVSADPDSPADIAAAVSRLLTLSQAELLEMGRRGYAAVLEHYTYERLANNVLRGLEVGRRI